MSYVLCIILSHVYLTFLCTFSNKIFKKKKTYCISYVPIVWYSGYFTHNLDQIIYI